MTKPTLSMVMNYPIPMFGEAAGHFGAVGGTWHNTSSAQHSSVMALTWEGNWGNAYRTVAAHDHQTVTAAADQALLAAQRATADGQAVGQALQRAWDSIAQAQSAGFEVGEDFSLTDLLPTPPKERQKRQEQAHKMAEGIGKAVTDLAVADARAASGMRSAGDFSQYHRSPNGHIMGVDYTVVNSDGSEHHSPSPPPHVGIINEHGGMTPVPVDPRDHNCTTREIVDGVGKVLVGAGTEAGGIAGAPVTGGASLAGVPAGAIPIYDGLDDLSHCTNLGRIPGGPPVAGQDGPG